MSTLRFTPDLKLAAPLALGLSLALNFAPAWAEDAPAPANKAPAFKAHVLTKAETDSWLSKPDQVLLIDVRRPDELQAKGQFPVYFSIQLKDLEKNWAYIPKDRTLITVSNHAGRAGRAADFLAEHGYKVAGATGVENYEAEGGQLLKLAPPPAKKPE